MNGRKHPVPRGRLPRIGLLGAAGALWIGSPDAAAAHQPVTGVSDAAETWNLDPSIVSLLVVTVALYVRGSRRLRGSAASSVPMAGGRWLLMAGGMGLIVVALISPLDALSSVLFSAHMTQHLLLTALGPLFLVLARPGLPLLLGAPGRLRRTVSRLAFPLRPVTRGPVAAALVVIAHAGVLWFWHVPPVYEAALSSPPLHAVEHATLFGTALMVWVVALTPGRSALGLSALVFTALQGVALGALLTLSPRILYPSYQTGAWGLSALEHQQLGGLLMWIPTGVVYAACCLGVLAHRVDLLRGSAAAAPGAGTSVPAPPVGGK